MRYRSRIAEPIPVELGPTGLGRKEREKIIQWLKSKRRGKRPTFNAYKCSSVSRALERLFGGKCAYCEAPYTRTQPVDIEHWRPKAGVDETKKPHLGYPWLAAAWENLLPSCTDCNRQRKQSVWKVEIRGRSVMLRQETLLVGKGNLFPLLNEKARVVHHEQDLMTEQPALIDPTVDRPEKFFAFRPDGVVVPNPSLNPSERTRALESIRVYALNRKSLVDERRERVLVLRSRFELLQTLIRVQVGISIQRTTSVRKLQSLLLDVIDREIRELKKLMQPDQPFSLLMRQFILAFLKQLKR